jgi:hypothetical protein
MFKHRDLCPLVHDTRVGGPRPGAPVRPNDHTQAGKATIDAEQQRLAGGETKAVTQEAWVKDRMAKEGQDLSPEDAKKLEARLQEEFKKYDQDNNGLDEQEFLALMQDRAQTGGDTHMGADGKGDLSEADKTALNAGVTERGASVKQRQHELNEQIKAGKIPGPPLAEDGLEGPKTRAAMAAAAKFERASAATIGGTPPTDQAAKDAAYDRDTRALTEANEAYEAMPAGAAKDSLGQQVQALAKSYDQKWGAYQQERQAADSVDGSLANPPKPGEYVGPDGKLADGAADIVKNQQALIQQAQDALKNVPDGPRKQALQAKIDGYKQAVEAAQKPAGAAEQPTTRASEKLAPYLDANGKLDVNKLEADRADGKVDMATFKQAVKLATPAQRGYMLSQLDDNNSISGDEKAYAEAIVKQAEADGSTGPMVAAMQQNGTLDRDTNWAILAYSSPATLAKLPKDTLQGMYDMLPTFSSLGLNAYHDAYKNAEAALHGGGG